MQTLSDRHCLTNKTKISVSTVKLRKLPQTQVGFYMKYASFVFRTLNRPSFQRFLRWMLRKENIGEEMVSDVQVRVFPFRRKNGNGLAGNCNTYRGRIRIYPKTLEFCQDFMDASGKDVFISYAGSRARAALIHELLHLKYTTDEETVRELTKEYFSFFIQNRFAQSAHGPSVYDLVFNAKTIENLVERLP